MDLQLATVMAWYHVRQWGPTLAECCKDGAAVCQGCNLGWGGQPCAVQLPCAGLADVRHLQQAGAALKLLCRSAPQTSTQITRQSRELGSQER